MPRVLVSSLIGHSLDVLDTGLPTVVVNHDYFPYCPAINLYFGAVCRSCDGERVGECHRDNGRFNPFVDFEPQERLRVRERFLEQVQRPNVTMVAPSRSVQENLVRLDARFGKARFATIPHGYGHPLQSLPGTQAPREGRLRIMVLGQLSIAKGVDLLRGALEELTRFAELYLIGTRELGDLFAFQPGVHVLSSYDASELPVHVANIDPHVGLLMSIVPETFSYALSELWMLGVPVAATRVGSFAERIEPGRTGYLFDPDPAAMVATLASIDRERGALAAVRAELQGWRPRTPHEMVEDYHRLTVLDSVPSTSVMAQAMAPAPLGAVATEQAMTLASMWKEVKRLNLQMSVAHEARQRSEVERIAEESRRRESESRAQDLNRALSQAVASHQDAVADRDRQVHNLATQLSMRNAQIAEIHASTSWRLTRPVRAVGHFDRKLGILARSLAAMARNPRDLPGHAASLARAWRAGGLQEVKKALVGLQPAEGTRDAWREYRETFVREVRPRIVERVREMATGPVISVLVPTYNTPEAMLKEMLDSVRAQLYPRWELCIADDGSSEPRVHRILKEYAARDSRIKLDLGAANGGVSRASNRALAMASGDFVVLLDHDDLLEEQALFRVAQSVLEDGPDMVYSDEVLVTPDGAGVRQWVYRPAFSPNFLRAHPYIVHLVGFRRQLLLDVGGFDEALAISQDYDLILRAAEQAERVVHIPEILYRWRIHGDSAGHRKMGEVMQVSRAALQRHLDRSGVQGTVADGAGFNFFDARYPLRDDLKVAIVIPTRNHGALLRQCIDSIRATVADVRCDLVVVDHQSDEPETLAYLASLAPAVRVMRYEGSFNFSAINNWAIAQLPAGYTHYLLCNNDIEAIAPGWLDRMLELGQQPSVGIVGAKLLYPDRRTLQHAGVCFGAFHGAEHYGKFLRLPDDRLEPGYFGALVVNHEVAAVTAACLLISREAFAEAGGFDEAIAVGFGDVDLCLRVMQAGRSVVFCPHAELVHHESYTRGTSTQDPHPEDTRLYRFKWRELLAAGDPYYNPGLSLLSTTWAACQPMHCAFEITRRIARRSREPERLAISFSREAQEP